MHYFHDNSDVSLPWARGQVISTRGHRAGAIIQSDFGGGDHGNFEVVVLGGTSSRTTSTTTRTSACRGQRGQVISSAGSGPGAIIQCDFGAGDHGNFEVVVLEGTAVHYFHDNSDVNLPWARGQTIRWRPRARLHRQSSYGPAAREFEVLVQESTKSVVHMTCITTSTSLSLVAQLACAARFRRGLRPLARHGPDDEDRSVDWAARSSTRSRNAQPDQEPIRCGGNRPGAVLRARGRPRFPVRGYGHRRKGSL